MVGGNQSDALGKRLFEVARSVIDTDPASEHLAAKLRERLVAPEGSIHTGTVRFEQAYANLVNLQIETFGPEKLRDLLDLLDQYIRMTADYLVKDNQALENLKTEATKAKKALQLLQSPGQIIDLHSEVLLPLNGLPKLVEAASDELWDALENTAEDDHKNRLDELLEYDFVDGMSNSQVIDLAVTQHRGVKQFLLISPSPRQRSQSLKPLGRSSRSKRNYWHSITSTFTPGTSG